MCEQKKICFNETCTRVLDLDDILFQKSRLPWLSINKNQGNNKALTMVIYDPNEEFKWEIKEGVDKMGHPYYKRMCVQYLSIMYHRASQRVLNHNTHGNYNHLYNNSEIRKCIRKFETSRTNTSPQNIKIYYPVK